MTRFDIVQIRLTQTLGRKSVEERTRRKLVVPTNVPVASSKRLIPATYANGNTITTRMSNVAGRESSTPVEEPPLSRTIGIASGGSRSNRNSEVSLVLAMGGLDAPEQGEGTPRPVRAKTTGASGLPRSVSARSQQPPAG